MSFSFKTAKNKVFNEKDIIWYPKMDILLIFIDLVSYETKFNVSYENLSNIQTEHATTNNWTMDKKHNQKIGKIGEETACKFLMKHGYQIVLRNYRKKWGEIDIIAKKDDLVCFVEVKTVSKNLTHIQNKNIISHETKKNRSNKTLDEYRPEDNIHPGKLKRISRTVQTYLNENPLPESDVWQFDAVTVFLDIKNKKALIDHIKDIIL